MAKQKYGIIRSPHGLRATLEHGKNFEERLVKRFRAPRNAEQLGEALRAPVQDIGESADAYEERYRCLYAEQEALGDGIPFNSLCQYWIMDLH